MEVKPHFGYRKVHYRYLTRNTQSIAMQLGIPNLLMAGRNGAA